MADSKKTKLIDGFKNDAKIDVEIDANMYTRLAQLLLDMALDQKIYDVPTYIREYESRGPKNQREYHLYTMCILVSDIEAEFKDSGQVTKIEVEVDDGSTEPDSSDTPAGS